MKSLPQLFKRMPSDGKARYELRRFNLGMGGTGKIPSVQQLASRLGFDVYLVDMPKSERGRLDSDPFAESGYRIEVNANDDVKTRRWSVLHELMHFYLHPSADIFAAKHRSGDFGHFYDSQEVMQEREANNAVEALIFGDGALEAALSLYGDDNLKIARHFGTSLVTVTIARSNFGI